VKRGGILKRYTPLKRKTPLHAVGNRGAEFNAELDAMRPLIHQRSEGRCEYPTCDHWAHHVHHITLRSAGGTNDLSNLLHLCWWHHSYIHDNPADAEAMRLIVRPRTWSEIENGALHND